MQKNFHGSFEEKIKRLINHTHIYVYIYCIKGISNLRLKEKTACTYDQVRIKKNDEGEV